MNALQVIKDLFRGWSHDEAELTIKADMDVGRGLGMSEVFEMRISHIGYREGLERYSCRLGLNRGDGDMGLHQRTIFFDPKTESTMILVSRAFEAFKNVEEN